MGRAASATAGLADVVCSSGNLPGESVAGELRLSPAPRLDGSSRTARRQSVPGRSAALHSCATLRLFVYRLADPPRLPRLVEARASRDLPSARFALGLPRRVIKAFATDEHG